MTTYTVLVSGRLHSDSHNFQAATQGHQESSLLLPKIKKSVSFILIAKNDKP